MTKLLKADHSRRIDLAGVGPAPRPVDIDQAQTGFSALKTLRIYRFEPPAVVHGHAEDDEVFIIVLAGEVDLTVKSDHWSESGTRHQLRAPNAKEPLACAAYLPPHAEYELTARSTTDVAYARALPAAGRPPAVFYSKPGQEPSEANLLLDESAHAERLRLQLWQVESRESAVDLVSVTRPVAKGEALIHVRAPMSRTLTVNAPGLPGVALESWDTLAVAAGERPQIRVAARSSALGLVVSAV